MAKYALGTLFVFALSGIWLFAAWSSGNKTKSWDPTQAVILGTEVQKTLRGRPAGYITHVEYVIGESNYEAFVDEHLYEDKEGQTTVYVNPDDSTQVVGITGARMQDMGRPLIATIASGLFAIVLLLIAFSPKED